MSSRIEALLRGTEPVLAALVRAAAVAALEAGAIIRSLYDQPHQLRFKGLISLLPPGIHTCGRFWPVTDTFTGNWLNYCSSVSA